MFKFEVTAESFKRTAAISAAALAITFAFGKAESVKAESPSPQITAAYLETDLNSSAYKKAERLDLSGLNRLILAFATAGKTGELRSIPIPAPAKEVIDNMPPNSDLVLAVGGQKASREGWQAALDRPEQFAASANKVAMEVESQTGRKIDGLDIDFEFPAKAQAGKFVNLIKTLRKDLPGYKLSIAIPPTEYNRAGFEFKELNPLVDNYEVMAYDFHGPWEKTAGDVAAGTDVLKSIAGTTKETGGAAKIIVGVPGYGYVYNHAKKRGDKFKGASTIPLNQIHMLTNDSNNLSSEAEVNGNWTSLQSPAMVKKTYSQLEKTYPDLAGAVYWQLPDLTQSSIQAIQP